MSESLKHRFNCENCLDRGWTIEQGFSPAFASRAEMVPCPACRPEKPSSPPSGWPFSWCRMTDRRKQIFSFHRQSDRRTRVMDRRQHGGPLRFMFIPVSDFFRRFILGGL